MPLISNVTLTGTAPASVTFSVNSRTPESTSFMDRRRLIPNLFGSLIKTVKQLRDTTKKLTGSYRVSAKITEPVVRTVDGVEVVIDNHIFEINCRVAGAATLAEKQHALRLLQSYAAHASFVTSIETGESDF